MNEKRLKLALIGRDVKNSKSGNMHRFILRALGADCDYELVSVDEADFYAAFSRLVAEKDGINVTIPYKRTALALLDGLSPEASAIGAINTVLPKGNAFSVHGKTLGFNTDGVGFMQMLRREEISVQGKSVLVLGAGGAGRSVAVALKNAGAAVYMTRKNEALLDGICKELGVHKAPRLPQGGIAGKYALAVNCTGVGMHATEGISPVTEAELKNVSLAIDLIYRPAKSAFLEQAERLGKRTLNGKAMLFYQAYYADCLYLGCPAQDEQADELYENYLKEEEQ
ncbi:MAG: shikimate dehydrogenase [Clostridia bacterium]|nr:shikimate dehydrogenase [Clostridia bacterium]